MKFYLFHFMPYLHADLNFRERGQSRLIASSHDFTRMPADLPGLWALGGHICSLQEPEYHYCRLQM